MNIQKKRGWIFGGVSALILVGTLAQFTTSRAQTDAPVVPANTAAVAPANAAPAELPQLPADLSPGLADVIKLSQSNVGDDVIVGYINNTGNISRPSADEILYLNDLGVSQNVINALMQNGNSGQAGVATLPSAPAQAPQQIPTSHLDATLSSPEVPTDSVAQDAPPDVAPVSSAAVVEQTPPPEVTVNYFYDQLSPYGSWVDVEGYGRCWRPSVAVVNAGWRPYCDNGYWVNTDAGWYWRSYYTWGWAPFHYGRWCSTPRYGWCWLPDSTWGPAWVAWRQHDRYCGWAPLPPSAVWRPGVGIVWAGGHGGHVDWGFGLSFGAFTFVGYDHFTDHHPWRHQAPHNEVVNIYNHSTVINNTVIVHNHNTIINNGVPKEKIVQATHKPVQTVVLKDARSSVTHGRMDHSAGKPALEVYRPNANVIAKTAAKPVVHNRPVLINSTPRTGPTISARAHSTFDKPTKTPASYSPGRQSPMVTPKASTHDTVPFHSTTRPSASAEAHQAWPGENVSGSSSHASSAPARTSRAEPSEFSSEPRISSSPRYEADVHSTSRSANGAKAVEQPSNYYGSGGYHSSGVSGHAAASSAPAAHSSAIPYSAHPAASGGGHGYSGGNSRNDNGGKNR